MQIIDYKIPSCKIEHSMYVTKHPTMNCQLCAFGCFDSFLARHDFDSNSNKEKRDIAIKEFKDIIFKTSQQNIVLIDVHTTLSPSVVRLFPSKNIIGRLPYTSTNSSSMEIFLINMLGL